MVAVVFRENLVKLERFLASLREHTEFVVVLQDYLVVVNVHHR